MEDRRFNQVIAGYHMLMILSHSDGEFSPEEGLEVVNYLEKSFPFSVPLDNKLEILATLDPSDYFSHFVKSMNDFYLDSTEKERTKFLNTAVKMVMADKKITKEENQYLRELFNSWDNDHLN